MRKIAVSAVVLASLGAIGCNESGTARSRAASTSASAPGSSSHCRIGASDAGSDSAAGGSSLDGNLRIYIGEGFEAGISKKGYYLETSDGMRPLVASESDLAGLKSGSRIRVQLAASPGAGLLASDRTIRALSIQALPSPANIVGATTTGALKLAIIPVNFSNDSVQCSVNTIKSTVFGSATSPGAAGALMEVSLNRLQITGDVLAPVSISDTTDDAMNYMQWGQEADAALQARGTSLAGYTHFVYVFPFSAYKNGIAGWAGLGDNKVFNMGACNYGWVYEHELGHDFGFDHAGTTDASGAPGYANYDTKDVMGYDYFDPRMRHTGAPYKEFAGWLPSSSYRTITASGSFQLSPMEVSSTSTQVIKFQRSGSTRVIYVSYRKALGIDAFFADLGYPDFVDVAVVDTSYPNAAFNAARLRLGESATEANSQAKVTFRSLSGSVASVDVDLSGLFKPLPTPTPPAGGGGGTPGGGSGGGPGPQPTPKPTPSGSSGC